MQTILTIAERHGTLIVFLSVLLSQGGLPLPVLPTLMAVAALARQSPYQITQIIVAGVSSALIAETALYWCGLHYGQRFLGLLCRLSFSPDFCVRRTEEVFARVGSWSLLFAKFIPGLSLITVAMAGVTKMTVLAFLLLDGIGARHSRRLCNFFLDAVLMIDRNNYKQIVAVCCPKLDEFVQ